MKVKSLSCFQLFATPWIVVYQGPPSMGFPRQEFWSGLPFPSPGYLPNPGIEPRSPAGWCFTIWATREEVRLSQSSWGGSSLLPWPQVDVGGRGLFGGFTAMKDISLKFFVISKWGCVHRDRNQVRKCLSHNFNLLSFPGASDGKESAYSAGRPGFDPLSRKIPWRREWIPTPVFLPGESHGKGKLVGYNPWGWKDSDMTEWLNTSIYISNLFFSKRFW